MSWEVDKGPGATLSRGCKRSDFVALLGGKKKTTSGQQTSTHPVIFGSVWSTAVSDGGLCSLELS